MAHHPPASGAGPSSDPGEPSLPVSRSCPQDVLTCQPCPAAAIPAGPPPPGHSSTVRVIIPQTGPPPVPTSRIPSSRPAGGAILSWSYLSLTTRTPVHTSPVMSVCPVRPSAAMSVCSVHPSSSVPPSQDPVPSSCPCPLSPALCPMYIFVS